MPPPSTWLATDSAQRSSSWLARLRQPRQRWACSVSSCSTTTRSAGGGRRGARSGSSPPVAAVEAGATAATTASWSRRPAAVITIVAGRYQRSKNAGDVVAGDRLDGGHLAEHLAPERVVGEQRPRQRGVHPVLGRVEVHEDLLDDHLPLGLDLGGPERRRGEHVGEDLDAERRSARAGSRA